MRKLGVELGVEAMSLYRYVVNKSDLLDGMIDGVCGEIDLPSDPTDWRSAMRRRAISAREVRIEQLPLIARWITVSATSALHEQR